MCWKSRVFGFTTWGSRSAVGLPFKESELLIGDYIRHLIDEY